MPAELAEALNKKGGLSLTQLAIYDDLLTDALVDRVYYWATIRKVRPNARPFRGIREEDVCRVLQQSVIIDKDPIAAQKALLKLSGFQNYMRSLRTEDEREHFERHLRKYINVYLPDCPFEVGTTHRYTINTAEASVVARKNIKAGEVIKYLSGIQVEMTEEEEAGLSNRTDFSIVLSSRRKRPSLFLGPARFANHDCDSNARLTTTGPHGISIVACKNIAIGDEITVKYGVDYFGEKNCECLCGSCELNKRNGWDSRGPLLRDDSSDEESEAEDERPIKRRRTDGIFTSSAKASSTSASSHLKRPYDTAFTTQELMHSLNMPKKRGRPRKHPLQFEIAKLEGASRARDFMALWLETRANQEDVNANIDVIQVGRAMHNRHRSRKFLMEDIPEDKEHYAKFNQVLDIMTKREQSEVEGWQARIASVKAENAALLGISITDAEKYYLPPDHPDFIPLPCQAQDTPKQSARNSGRQELDTVQQSPSASSAGQERQKRSPEKVRVAAMRRQHTSSPLRNVTMVDAMDQDTPRALAIEQHSSPGDEASAQLAAESAQASTDESSRSSIFSHEAIDEAVSPPSSHGGDMFFRPENISQDIIDMYTTGVDDHEEVDEELDETKTEDQCKSSATPMNSIEQQDANDSDTESSEEERRGEPRTPGDYHLCSALLIDINDRWIECRNCDEHFVQHDAYQTRIACPRCERHSKLYGYHWPKTDRSGKDDREERILDHRLIHRFIEPDEERQERKGRRTLAEMLRERELSASQEETLSITDTRDISRRRSRRLG